jgi:hypothetical protein
MVAPVIFQNAAYIGGASTILAGLGCLWFRSRGLPKDAQPLARVALYPILGWMLLVVGASWLRIVALLRFCEYSGLSDGASCAISFAQSGVLEEISQLHLC